jgi:hypothetical protein
VPEHHDPGDLDNGEGPSGHSDVGVRRISARR